MHITIVGIGGVGGYLAAVLQEYAQGHPDADLHITLVAREAHAAIIRQQGLEVRLPERTLLVHPTAVFSQLPIAAAQDLIICCTKSYDLPASLAAVRAGIGAQTAILPLLNGLGATEYLQQQLPNNLVLEGCVYIIAKLLQQGVVQVTSSFQRIHWGAVLGNTQRCQDFQDVFTAAGITSVLEPNIRQVVWEKYFFISPMATCTCATDSTLLEILATPQQRMLLEQLMHELMAVAQASGHMLSEQLYDTHLTRYAALPAGTASSMHHDMRLGKPTEIDALVHDVIRRGATWGVPTPGYMQALDSIQANIRKYSQTA